MLQSHCTIPAIRQAFLAAGIIMSCGFAPASVFGADNIDPESDKILHSMSTYMSSLSAFSVNADVDNEIIDLQGQKLQLSSSATAVIERPAKFHMARHGVFADAEVFFDGKTVTLHGKNHNVYAQIEGPGSIEGAFDSVEFETGLDMPGSDLLHADSYPLLTSETMSSTYHGTAFVEGIECHYMSFRKAKVDWQLWVQAGETPLPMKYVITTKWMTGAPQYSVRFRDWDTQPKIEANRFKFSIPKGATQLDTFHVNEAGEPILEEVK